MKLDVVGRYTVALAIDTASKRNNKSENAVINNFGIPVTFTT